MVTIVIALLPRLPLPRLPLLLLLLLPQMLLRWLHFKRRLLHTEQPP